MSLARACEAFGRRFGRAPTLAARSPGRVNLIGEHTDYNDGLVMPVAIDRWCVAVARESGPEGRLVVESVGLQDSLELDLSRGIEPGEQGLRERPWGGYVAGVVAGVQQRAGRTMPGLEMSIAGDVPIGAGLSSSAALEAAVSLVVERALGIQIPAMERAMQCREAEHHFAGVPCGVMDQMAVNLAREGHAMEIDCRDLSVRHAPLPAGAAIVLADSGVAHELSAGGYARCRRACERAARALGIASLRDADAADVRRCADLDDEARRCARHVTTENERVERFAQALRTGDLHEAGRLMDGSHASLRADLRVSTPELDALVEIAHGVPGVYGSRLTGGGFGGCAVTLVDPDGVARLESALRQQHKNRFGLDCKAFQVRSVRGASIIEC